MNKAEQLIACLEGEIAKRDARIMELEEHNLRLGQGGAERYWEGRWRDADAELSKTMRQQPVGEVVEVNDSGNCSFKGVINASAILEDLVVSGTKLYAAPVSEAKAQGVVMPERRTDTGSATDDRMDIGYTEGWNGYADEFARLNAAPVQQVNVPDVSAMARILADRNADACNVNREDNWAVYGQDYIDDVTAMLAAAPAPGGE